MRRVLNKKSSKNNELEQIDLLRGGLIVSTFVGAFGGSIRETRLTALLGYLIALEPKPFLKFFGFEGDPRVVRLENQHENDRSDIFIETSAGTGVIEAKVDATDPLEQSKKYKARWTVLLTQHIKSNLQANQRSLKYIRWQQLVDEVLNELVYSRNPKVKFMSDDLYNYLEEYHMIKQREAVEIYARDLNKPTMLALFLQAHMYCCPYEESSRLPQALYFAPYFGQSIANELPGVHVGISYVAKIEYVEVIETWREFLDATISVRGKHFLNSHFSQIKPLKTGEEWWNEGRKKSILFLGEPRLVFNPAVQKDYLMKGKGFLNKNFFSFEELFKAWGC